MFSIIMPVFNEEKRIAESIKSILNQTYQLFELIVIDDGSSDNSLSIIKSIHDHRLKVISQKNQGASAARNTGIKESTLDYILFVDADDSISNNLLLDLSVKVQSETADLFFFRTSINNFNKYRQKKFDLYSSSGNIFLSQSIINEDLNPVWGKVYKTQIVKQINLLFNTNLKIAEDLYFNLEYLRYVKTAQILDVGFYYYADDVEDSLTSNLSLDKFESLVLFHKLLSDSILEKKFIESLNKELSFIWLKNKNSFFLTLFGNGNGTDLRYHFELVNSIEIYDEIYRPSLLWKIIFCINNTNSYSINKFFYSVVNKLRNMKN